MFIYVYGTCFEIWCKLLFFYLKFIFSTFEPYTCCMSLFVCLYASLLVCFFFLGNCVSVLSLFYGQFVLVYVDKSGKDWPIFNWFMMQLIIE